MLNYICFILLLLLLLLELFFFLQFSPFSLLLSCVIIFLFFLFFFLFVFFTLLFEILLDFFSLSVRSIILFILLLFCFPLLPDVFRDIPLPFFLLKFLSNLLLLLLLLSSSSSSSSCTIVFTSFYPPNPSDSWFLSRSSSLKEISFFSQHFSFFYLFENIRNTPTLVVHSKNLFFWLPFSIPVFFFFFFFFVFRLNTVFLLFAADFSSLFCILAIRGEPPLFFIPAITVRFLMSLTYSWAAIVTILQPYQLPSKKKSEEGSSLFHICHISCVRDQ